MKFRRMALNVEGTVQPAVGDRASTELSFTPALGEACGYCASGAD
ncbi:hypothetical protein ACIA8E_34530 [Streptomyces sp. NPDC051664]